MSAATMYKEHPVWSLEYGARMIGTRIGATIEFAEEVGEKNVLLFGGADHRGVRGICCQCRPHPGFVTWRQTKMKNRQSRMLE